MIEFWNFIRFQLVSVKVVFDDCLFRPDISDCRGVFYFCFYFTFYPFSHQMENGLTTVIFFITLCLTYMRVENHILHNVIFSSNHLYGDRSSWSHSVGDQQGHAKLGTRLASHTQKWRFLDERSTCG